MALKKLTKKIKREPISASAMFISLALALYGNIIKPGSMVIKVPAMAIAGMETGLLILNIATWAAIVFVIMAIYLLLFE